MISPKDLKQLERPDGTVRGVLVDVFDVGVLITGDSGIGKSESALDLITRGHKLVADDIIEIKSLKGKRLVGAPPKLTRDILEIRGIGLINVKNTFGSRAAKAKTDILLLVELVRWTSETKVDRLGIDIAQQEIAGVMIEKFQLPVSPGRNLAVLVETAVRIFKLRRSGSNAAVDFVKKHDAMLRKASI